MSKLYYIVLSYNQSKGALARLKGAHCCKHLVAPFEKDCYIGQSVVSSFRIFRSSLQLRSSLQGIFMILSGSLSIFSEVRLSSMSASIIAELNLPPLPLLLGCSI